MLKLVSRVHPALYLIKHHYCTHIDYLTCCTAANTSILIVTTVTCDRVIAARCQVVFSASASQVIEQNGTSALSKMGTRIGNGILYCATERGRSSFMMGTKPHIVNSVKFILSYQIAENFRSLEFLHS